MGDKTLDTTVSQCPERIYIKTAKKFNRIYSYRMELKEFTSEIPILYVFKNPSCKGMESTS